MELSLINKDRLNDFSKKGAGHLAFACHASVPFIFSIDFLYKLLLNFNSYKDGTGSLHKIPYYVVSDLILSSFCKPIDHQLYKMEDEIRWYLQDTLVEISGQSRRVELALFLKEYAEKFLTIDEKNIQDIHLFTAGSVLDPINMEKEMAMRIADAAEPYEKINYLTLYFSLSRSRHNEQGGNYITIVSEDDPHRKDVIKLPLSKLLQSMLQKGDEHNEVYNENAYPRQHALDLINECLEKKITRLEIGRCGLTDEDFKLNGPIDLALIKCTHLTELVISNQWSDEENDLIIYSKNLGEGNLLNSIPRAVASLPNLKVLKCGGDISGKKWGISDISVLAQLKVEQYDLSFNEINDLSPLKRAHRIHNLNLRNNKINSIRSISYLGQLKTVNLSDNIIRNIVPLFKLKLLKNVALDNCQIADIGIKLVRNLSLAQHLEHHPEDFFSGFRTLSKISVKNNQIRDIRIFKECINLLKLDLSGNEIEDISPLKALTLLTEFYADDNKISNLSALSKLTQIKRLSMSGNVIDDIAPLSLLSSVNYLDLGDNKIYNVKPLANLMGLRGLNLSNNSISDISEITSLLNLNQLYLENNQINSIHGIEKLVNLTTLNINFNSVDDLKPLTFFIDRKENRLEIVFNEKPDLINKISIKGNPLVSPPLEIAELGNEAILSYFQSILSQEQLSFFEPNLVLVGQPRAGKTSLRHKLFDDAADLAHEATTTRGIDIQRIKFISDPSGFRGRFFCNVWDFGGQHIYNSTYQFFLPGQSLFLLLIDPGNGNDATTIDYWLQTIELLRPRNPVFLVVNEKNNRTANIDIPAIMSRFKTVKGFYQIDLNALSPETVNFKQKRLEEFLHLKEDIEHELKELPGAEDYVPQSWINIGNYMRSLSNVKPYINRKEYFEICNKFGLTGRQNQLALSKTFHQQGVFFHFQTNPTLSGVIFLQKVWVTDAIFAIFDSFDLQKEKGRIPLIEIAKIFKKREYSTTVHKKLLALMIQFEICFQPNSNSKEYIFPELLPDIRPITNTWDLEDELSLCYKYDFMPRVLFTRLMARLSKSLKLDFKQFVLWKSGMEIIGSKLNFPGTAAEIIESWSNRNLTIKTSGIWTKYLMQQICSEIDGLNNEIFDQGNDNLKRRYQKLIPCNCKVCKNKDRTHYFDYEELLKRKEFGKSTIECQNAPFNSVNIEELLKEYTDQPPKNDSGKLRISILCSGKDMELASLLNYGIEEHLFSENGPHYKLWTKHEIDRVPDWEKVINESINKNDIVLLLVSANFVSSKHLTKNELIDFFNSKQSPQCLIIPILTRNYNFVNFEQGSGLTLFKAYYSDYGFNKPAVRNRLMAFDVLGDNVATTDKQLNDYYHKLALYIQKSFDEFRDRKNTEGPFSLQTNRKKIFIVEDDMNFWLKLKSWLEREFDVFPKSKKEFDELRSVLARYHNPMYKSSVWLKSKEFIEKNIAKQKADLFIVNAELINNDNRNYSAGLHFCQDFLNGHKVLITMGETNTAKINQVHEYSTLRQSQSKTTFIFKESFSDKTFSNRFYKRVLGLLSDNDEDEELK